MVTASLFWLNACAMPCDLNQTACLRRAYSRSQQHWPAPSIDSGIAYQDFSPIPPLPAFNPQQQAQITLGKMLFNEKRLSSDGTISCATCHIAQYGFAQPQRVATGVMGRQGRRNAPSLLHLWQHNHTLFWDGRATSLAEQMQMSLADPNEMNMDLARVPEILNQAGYGTQFEQIFGKPISLELVAEALAAYQSTFRPQPTRFDNFLNGKRDALNDIELRGLHLFRTKARCLNCHYGAMLTDHKLHNLNVTLSRSPWRDFGRFEITQQQADWGKFKTPHLRNLLLTKPWFHNGMFQDFNSMLHVYNLGLGNPGRPRDEKLDPQIQELHLTPEEQRALKVFLESL